MASPISPPMINGVDKLTNDIFSILENKFLFGCAAVDHHPNPKLSINVSSPAKVRILTIDTAGSTNGILAAKALLHLQTILRRKSGNPTAHIADFFDLVSGAGAGGILAALLFTRGADGAPMFSAEDSLKFIFENYRKLVHHSSPGVFSRTSRAEKLLKKVFGELTLKDTLKAVLIPCYDLKTGAPFVFSRADALEMDGCDFTMAGVCAATVADRAMELKSINGSTKIVAVGGGVGMSNPSAAAITHVLNNKQEFPLCKGVEDLLVISLGNGESVSAGATFAKIAADGAADMVDQAVSMAFGESRKSNYVRIQGNGRGKGEKRNMFRMVDDMLGEKNVESVLFKGKKLIEYTNLEKLEMFGGELIKEQERRKNTILPTVLLKNSMNTLYSPRSSSATTLSTNSSS